MKSPDLSRHQVFAPHSSVCIINHTKLFDVSAVSTEHVAHQLIFGYRTVSALTRHFDDLFLSCKLIQKGVQR
jgi:hypothetical protein